MFMEYVRTSLDSITARLSRLEAEREADERIKRYRHPEQHWRPTPLRDTCRCDERMSRYKSSLGVTVPLSYRSRHLMEDLRYAATDAIVAGKYSEQLQAARLALAERLSELEQYALRCGVHP